MNRLIPTFILGSMLLGGTALAQSFEPPSRPGLSSFPDVGVPQIDPPSLQIDTGPADTNGDGDGDTIPDFAEAGGAIASGISEALVTTAADIVDALGPGIFPDVLDETGLGVALLELSSAIEEEVRKGLQQGRVILDSDFGAIEEEVRKGLQQGRVLLDSDFGAAP